MWTPSLEGKPVSLLLVEDDDGDAKAVRRAFAKERIANTIMRAHDGLEAFEILRGENGREKLEGPYLILLDLNMPRMNGLKFLEELRKDRQLRGSIVFVLTTSNRDEDRAAAYDLNVSGYILKERAGADFVNLVALMDCYWRIVELPR